MYDDISYLCFMYVAGSFIILRILTLILPSQERDKTSVLFPSCSQESNNYRESETQVVTYYTSWIYILFNYLFYIIIASFFIPLHSYPPLHPCRTKTNKIALDEILLNWVNIYEKEVRSSYGTCSRQAASWYTVRGIFSDVKKCLSLSEHNVNVYGERVYVMGVINVLKFGKEKKNYTSTCTIDV